ncbi:MAG TPA: hypothetical protein P5322_09975, partial [Spirochaetota bacterium]|nr:hypothetical protein [Spirochaetota bacterium]
EIADSGAIYRDGSRVGELSGNVLYVDGSRKWEFSGDTGYFEGSKKLEVRGLTSNPKIKRMVAAYIVFFRK